MQCNHTQIFTMQSTLHPYFTIVLLFVSGIMLTASPPSKDHYKPQQSIFDLLPNHDEAIPVQIKVNLSDLFEDRRSEEVQKGILTFKDDQGVTQEWRFKAELRGKYRRRMCDFPPIKLDFSKKDLQLKNMLPFDDLKLVTHCLDDPTGNTIVQREFLAYELYRQLSKYSYRAKLVEVTYIDTGDSNNSITRLGIIIEDTDQLMDRLNITKMDTIISNADGLISSNEMNHAMFQYMIGNGDWNIQVRKNLKLGLVEKDQKFVAIPYDFDFSGLVNSKYSVPKAAHDIQSVQDRVYLGKPRSIAELQPTIDKYLSKKEQLMNYIDTAKWMSKATKRYASNYLEKFYKDIEDGKINFSPDDLYR